MICGAVIAAGIASGRGGTARTGTRMLAAHILANTVKRRIKNRLRRTRPDKVVEQNHYLFRAQDNHDGRDASFPSGHTAGAIAVSAIVVRDMPTMSLPAATLGLLAAAVQIPRAKHYPTDVLAGAALGLAAAWVVNTVLPQNSASQHKYQEKPMSDNATKTVSALFDTREAADYAIEHLVQQHGIDRADIFAEPQGAGNSAGNRPSGSDRKGDVDGAALNGALKLSVDIAGDKVATVQDTFREYGGQDVAQQ